MVSDTFRPISLRQVLFQPFTPSEMSYLQALPPMRSGPNDDTLTGLSCIQYHDWP